MVRESNTPQFPDHFSKTAGAYATFRPRYPRALIQRIAEMAPARRLAWDCATGNGQAAVALGEFFDRVIATDASEQQIANAVAHPRVEYRVARGEASGLPEHCADLVCVAQALHWLDVDAFHREADRVLVPGGLLAEIAYGSPDLPGDLNEILHRFYQDVVGPYWPPERAHIESGYADVPFPYPRVPVTAPPMERDVTLEELLGYVGTWSAVQRYRASTGKDPLPAFAAEMTRAWGTGAHRLTWPVVVRAGYSPS